mgnify:CR=1 FL=1
MDEEETYNAMKKFTEQSIFGGKVEMTTRLKELRASDLVQTILHYRRLLQR